MTHELRRMSKLLEALDELYQMERLNGWLDRLMAWLPKLTGVEQYLGLVFAPALEGPVGDALAFGVSGAAAGRLLQTSMGLAQEASGDADDFRAALAACFRGPAAFTQASVAGPEFFTESTLGRALRREGVVDQAILATSNAGSGALLAIGLQHADEPSAQAVVPLLSQLAPHASACARLVQRELLRQRQPIEARIRPNGKVLHADGRATSRPARQRLASAVANLERARGAAARRDPEAALALRVALVAGRWSLLEHWETGTHRYWVAIENRPRPPGGPAPLTPRQRQVVFLLGRGLRVTDIARELGVSKATVEVHLRDACRRLGVKGRAGLLGLLAHPVAALGD